MNEIIVIGGNHHNTLSVIRALGFKGISPHLIVVCESKYPYVKYSRYLADVHIIDNANLIGNCMMNNYNNYSSKPIVIACSDEISSYLDLNHDYLSKRFIVPGSSIQGKITELMNKTLMVELAKQSGFNTPDSKSVLMNSLDESFIMNLNYPIITKPLKSIEGSKYDIYIFNTPDEFLSHCGSIKCDEIQVQNYIDKDFEFQLIGCSLDYGNRVIIPGASIILRQPRNTNTGFLRYVPITKLKPDLKSCKKFLQAARYSGLFSMEFLRGKDGKDYFMEINFRNDGNAICVTAAGVNLPYIWSRHCMGEEIDSYLKSCYIEEIFVMPEFSDFKNVLSNKVSLIAWLRDLKRTDAFMDWCKNDQRPFWYYLPTKILNLFSKC